MSSGRLWGNRRWWFILCWKPWHEENIDADKNFGDGVKIEKDESLELDDCSIDLRAD